MVDFNSNIDDLVKGTPPNLDVGSPKIDAPKGQDPEMAKISEQFGRYEKSVDEAKTGFAATAKKKEALEAELANRPQMKAYDPGPKPEKPPGAPPEANPLQAFGSPASWLAVFGGLLTKRPLQASLDASASAMEAYRKKDLDSYTLHLKQWQAESEYAAQLQHWQKDLYDAELKKEDRDLDRLTTRLKLIASTNDDKAAIATLESGVLGNFLKFHDDRARRIEHYDTARRELARDAESARRNMENEKIRREAISATLQRSGTVAAGKLKSQLDNLDVAESQLERAIKMATPQDGKLLGNTGIGGMLNRGIETATTTVDSTADTSATQLAQLLRLIQLEMPKLLTGTSKSAKDERAKVESIVAGLNPGDTGKKTVDSLKDLLATIRMRKKALATGKEELEAEPAAEAGAPAAGGVDLAEAQRRLDAIMGSE